ncbi:MAG: glucose-6-phosphate isomerase [Alphaproteobacteria bacterium]|nr:glucose-6-phosphate isomerase [Alphaproteobacteria bacterium]
MPDSATRLPAPAPLISDSPAWAALAARAARPEARAIRALFAADPGRAGRFTRSLDDLALDFAKTPIDAATLDLLLALARAADVEGLRARMAAGEAINNTEKRAVLHMALRAPRGAGFRADGADAAALAQDEAARMRAFVEAVHAGRIRGATGEPFAHVVNIGIGGSDLGPAMVVEALAPYGRAGIAAHFLANVDGAAIAALLPRLDPARTLFLIASKTFTTQETMANAAAARAWLSGKLGEAAVGAHFVALSTNHKAVAEFGIAADRTFGFWDWVGGRFSLWSAIGLSIALALGWDRFAALHAGARAMDEHFLAAPLEGNLPVLLALIGIWHTNFLGCTAHAVLPYDQRLARLPAFLQQLEMESNGKRVSRHGQALPYATVPVLFGEPGTNGQHAFYQELHQGPQIVPCDFLLAAQPDHDLPAHHRMLAANCFAQAEALLAGKNEAAARAEMQAAGMAAADIAALLAHRVFPGDRPSVTLLYRRLDPFALGRLIALYEHKVFVQGAVWGINSFDQWGVELGKQLAGRILPELASGPHEGAHDSSTTALIARFRALRGEG